MDQIGDFIFQNELPAGAYSYFIDNHDFTFNQPTPSEFQIPQTIEGEFQWDIKSPSKIVQKSVWSPTYTLGNFEWKLLLFPRGNGVDDLSIYIHITCKDSDNWSIDARFSVILENQLQSSKSIEKSRQTAFDQQKNEYGWPQFTDESLEEIMNPENGFLVNDMLIIKFNVQFEEIISNQNSIQQFYNTKEKYGYVGLLNQGATCYLNSILQSLFHLPYFRKIVYKIPLNSAFIYELQKLFFMLQHSNNPVSTLDFTFSLEWNTINLGSQNDVQEFWKIFQDKLEQSMKNSEVEGMMEKLFRGSLSNYIRCIDAPYESKRSEYFYDISLNVRGCKDVYESFKKYCEVEMLQGDDMYNADGHGFQNAYRGIIFEKFPPILHLHLKRYDYDLYLDQFVKVNDRFEFPEVLDLNEFVDPMAYGPTDYTYHLHGVLVHSGNLNGGHYRAFLKTGIDSEWYKFDDSYVTVVESKNAINDNFGVDLNNSNLTTYNNCTTAYLLVYILESERDMIFQEVTEEDVPEYLLSQLKEIS